MARKKSATQALKVAKSQASWYFNSFSARNWTATVFFRKRP